MPRTRWRIRCRDCPNKGLVEDHVPEGVKKLDRTVMLQRLFEHNWEALERCRIVEEDLAEKDLPPHALIPARVQLTKKQLKIVIELRRNEAEELLKQKADERFTAVVSRNKGDAGDQLENRLPDGPGKRSVEDHVTEGVKKLDRRVMLQALFVHNWDALERCRVTEEELVDNGLPVQVLVHATARLFVVQVGILTEWGRNDTQEFLKQKVMGSEGFPPPPLSDSAKQVLKQILQEFSPEDRRVLRQILDRG